MRQADVPVARPLHFLSILFGPGVYPLRLRAMTDGAIANAANIAASAKGIAKGSPVEGAFVARVPVCFSVISYVLETFPEYAPLPVAVTVAVPVLSLSIYVMS